MRSSTKSPEAAEGGSAAACDAEIPLFPLNAVVFPGVATPLHVFEDRYRAMVRELLSVEKVFDRVFGVVAIREGYEVGDHGTQSVHRVGTLVQLTEVTRG